MKQKLLRWDDRRELAREMRRCPTPAEGYLWGGLRGRRLEGLRFHRQHVIGPFIADFYCASAGLVVEVDGDVHDSEAEYDEARTRQFEDYGYRVIRFRNEEVLENIESVLSKIAETASVNQTTTTAGQPSSTATRPSPPTIQPSPPAPLPNSGEGRQKGK